MRSMLIIRIIMGIALILVLMISTNSINTSYKDDHMNSQRILHDNSIMFIGSDKFVSFSDTEVHFYLDKTIIYEDPRDSIKATICWKNLPPPLQDMFLYYKFYIVEINSRIVITEKIIFANYINSSYGCLDLDIHYLMNLYDINYIIVSGTWVAVIDTFAGSIASVERYNVQVIDKYSIADIIDVSYNSTQDTVIVRFSKDLSNALLLYRIITYDINKSVIRSVGEKPFWAPLWFNGSFVSLDIPGDPDPREYQVEAYLQKRGIKNYTFYIEVSSNQFTNTTTIITTETLTNTISTLTLTATDTMTKTIYKTTTVFLNTTITLTEILNTYSLITTTHYLIKRSTETLITILNNTLTSFTTLIYTAILNLITLITKRDIRTLTIPETLTHKTTIPIERTITQVSISIHRETTEIHESNIMPIIGISPILVLLGIAMGLLIMKKYRK
ncbi:MAG: hypothetical protein ACP5GI_00550 [Sulfolobales archaeon]